MITFQRAEEIAGAAVAALGLVGLGIYSLHTSKDNLHFIVGLVAILGALAVIVPVQLKAGAKALRDVGKDVHEATIIVLPTVATVVDQLPGGDRVTDPPAAPSGPVA